MYVLTIKSHDFSEIVDECGEMQPVVLGKFFSCTFSSLKCMHNVRQRRVRVGLIDELVQLLERLAYS